jgi:hypothetical protein
MARAAGTKGIRWTYDTLTPHLTLFFVAADKGLQRFTENGAQEVENYAQEHAPWQDRTGDARSGLTAEARHRLNHYYIDLFHTVDYGIWLEIRWDGRYAIIQPTLEHFGPQLMAELSFGEMLAYEL